MNDDDKQSLPSIGSALIIDDSVMVHDLLSKHLKTLHYSTYSAYTAKEGLTIFKKISPDFTFLDIVLPYSSGIDLLPQLKSINKKSVVIIITSYVSMGNIDEAREKGADWFLRKPLQAQKLLEVIRHFEASRKK